LLIKLLELLFAAIIILFLYSDSKRIFRAFFIHVERKLLIVHQIKLLIFLFINCKFRKFIPYDSVITFCIIMLILMFLTILTLRQVEVGIKDNRDPRFKTFKYGSKFSEYLLYLFASVMNFSELSKHKKEIREKTREIMYVAVFPVQKYIAVSITGLKFSIRKEKFITDCDLKDIRLSLEPGDILLKRNDWQATNLGISGFWTHAGLYIGSIQELDKYFEGIIPSTKKKFSERLKEINQEIYNKMIQNRDLSIIESIQEGVCVKPLSNIAKVDYFSALRPVTTKKKKMEAILRAFEYIGYPYDYSFDVESEDAFVCTALVRKAYENILSFELQRKLGKKVLLPSSIVKKFVRERKRKNKQLDFVLFYDLDIHTKKAFRSSEKEFIKSFRRNISYYKRLDILRYITTIGMRKKESKRKELQSKDL